MKAFLVALCLFLSTWADSAETRSVSSISPADIQADIVVMGTLILPKISPNTKLVLHNLAISQGSMPTFSMNVLFLGIADARKRIEPKDIPYADLVLDTFWTTINLAVAKYGEVEGIRSYVVAVANGLLAAGF